MTRDARSLGNCAEEIYYALLKAESEKKRALMLFRGPHLMSVTLATIAVRAGVIRYPLNR